MMSGESRPVEPVRIAVVLNEAVSTQDALGALLPAPWTVGLIAGEGGKRFAVCEAPPSESLTRMDVERRLRRALSDALAAQHCEALGQVAVHLDNPFFLGGTNGFWFLRACNDNQD